MQVHICMCMYSGGHLELRRELLNVDSGTKLKSLDLVTGTFTFSTISLTPQIVLKLLFSLWGAVVVGGGVCELSIWKARKALSMLGKQCTTNL